MLVFMKFLHVITAFGFVGGLVGRTLIMWQASQSQDIRQVAMLVRLASYFERWLVIPGSLALLGFGLVTAWLQQWALFTGGQGVIVNWLLVSTVLYLSIVPVIRYIFLPRGRVFGQALEQAVTMGTITPALNAAFRDRWVGAAHVYEWLVTIGVIYLMVSKPF